MHFIRCQTKEQLKTLIQKALFRPYYETLGDPDERELTPEQVCACLGFDPQDLLDERNGKEDPDLIDENLSMNEVVTHVLTCDGIPMLRDFKPGMLVFRLEGGFDRLGITEANVFHYVADEAMTFDLWMNWYENLQKAHKAQQVTDHQARLNWE